MVAHFVVRLNESMLPPYAFLIHVRKEILEKPWLHIGGLTTGSNGKPDTDTLAFLRCSGRLDKLGPVAGSGSEYHGGMTSN